MMLIATLIRIFRLLGLVFAFFITLIYIDGRGDEDIVADVGIIYGNKIERNGHPSERLKSRLDRAIDLYQTKRVNKLFVSGGIGIEGFDEAQVMRTYLVNHDIPIEDIVVDSLGNNTALTSQHAFHLWGKDTRVIAISQRYHISRAKLSLKQAGFTHVWGEPSHYMELRDGYSYIREIPAWFKYWFNGQYSLNTMRES